MVAKAVGFRCSLCEFAKNLGRVTRVSTVITFRLSHSAWFACSRTAPAPALVSMLKCVTR